VEWHCVYCGIGSGILKITEMSFGYEIVTLLLRIYFFLIWLCAKEICGGVPATSYLCLSVCLSVPIEKN
jgi:hypothetical protein